MKFMILLVAISIYAAGVECQNGPFYTTTCERNTGAYRCRDGFVIKIDRAFYGRDDSSTCRGTVKTTSCSARNALRNVEQRCNGKAYCVVPASNSVFGDPCKGTTKYTRITYRCIQDSRIKAIATICERTTGNIACPVGQTISVVDAFYGRDDSITCRGNAKSTTCRSASSLQTIKNLCDGNRSCVVNASNSVFGDPCKGTTKFAKVFYNCQ